MESLVLSIISSYLKDFVNNFRKDQISVNFLRGQGVIRDLDINVDAINEIIFQNNVPGLRFSRMIINTLSISAPIMSLKSKPIVVYIDEMFVEIIEVLDVPKKPRSTASSKRSFSKYGFMDRVVDSISFEINKIYASLRTLGKLKTTTIGPWTPPVLLVELTGNRFFCTNNNGVEAELDECLRVRLTKRPMLFVYKKFESKQASAYLVNPELWFSVADELLAENGLKQPLSALNGKYKGTKDRPFVLHKLFDQVPLTMGMCMRKRIENNILLGLELSFSINSSFRICLKQNQFSETIHFVYGLLSAMFRKDVVLEVYGPNPHNEVRNGGNPPTSSASSGATSASSTSQSQSIPRRHITREQLEKDAQASLDIMEAEVSPGMAVTEDPYERETSKGVWNSEEDPTHMRLVIAIEIPDAIVTLQYDDEILDNKVYGLSNHNFYRGVDIHINNFVWAMIWPEQAGPTEGVAQYTLKSFHVTEFIGTKRTSLCRTTTPLDHGGQPICVEIFPRGVKEYNQYDPETYAGTSFVYRKDSNWPPPPVSKGLAAKNECVISSIECNCNLDSTFLLMKYLAGSYDERWFTGDWGVPGRVEGMHSAGSSETVVICNGIKVFLFSDFTATDMGSFDSIIYSKTLLPSHILFEIGLTTLIWKHNLDLKIFAPVIGDLRSREALPYPHCDGDLCSVLKRVESIPEVELLSDRFEVSFSQITLKFSQESEGSNKYRTIIQPFSITYFSSIDPHPDNDLILPSPESFFDPYNRVYYWSVNSSTLASTFIRIEDFAIDCSLLDITRIVNAVVIIHEWMKIVFPQGIYTHPDVAPLIPEPANSVVIFRLDNIRVAIVEEDVHIVKERENQEDRLALDFKFINFIVEWKECPPIWNFDHMVLKLQVGPFSADIKGAPAFFMTNASIDDCLRLSWNISNSIKQSASTAVFSIRYEPAKSSLTSLTSSLDNEDNDKFSVCIDPLGRFKLVIASDVKLIGIAQPFETVVEDFVHEILHGHGIVHSNSNAIFDNCILGYWLNLYQRFKHTVIFVSDVGTAAIEDSTDSVETRRLDKHLEMIIEANNFEVALVDPFNRDDKFVSINVFLNDLLIDGGLSPAHPQYFHAKLNSNQYLVLYHGYSDGRTSRMIFSTPFMISGEVRRNSIGIYQMGLQLSVQNMFLNIDQVHFAVATEVISRLSLQLNRSTIALTSLLVAARNRLVSEKRIMGEDKLLESMLERERETKTALQLASGNIALELLTSCNNKPPIDVTRDDIEKRSEFSGNLVKSIQSLVKSCSKEVMLKLRNDEQFVSVVREDMQQLESVCDSLESIISRLQHIVMLSGYHTVIHCGWLRRSNGFSKSDRSVISNRCWCVLNSTALLFMSKPYSSKVDVEVPLSKAIEVFDPDEGNDTLGKNALTSKVWISGPEGVMVLDCDSLDEKMLWINALQPWWTQMTVKQMKSYKPKSRLSIALNLGSSSNQSLPQQGSSSNSNSSASNDANAGSEEPDGGHRRSRFKSAARGVMKALSLNRKSTSAPVKSSTPTLIDPVVSLSSQFAEVSMDPDNNSESVIVSESSTTVSVTPQKQQDKLASGSSPPSTSIGTANTTTLPVSFPTVIADILEDLSDFRGYVSQYRTAARSMNQRVDSFVDENTSSYRNCHNAFMSLTVGLFGLETVVRELATMSSNLNKESDSIIQSLSNRYQNTLKTIQELSQECIRAIQKRLESESVLEACTLQNINTVVSMSKQYDDLMEYYNALRYGDTAAAMSNSANIHEMVKNLTSSLREMEKMLKQSEEKEKMLSQELDCIVIETDITRQQNLHLSQQLKDSKKSSVEAIESLEHQLSSAMREKEVAIQERDVFKQRYEALLLALKNGNMPDLEGI